MKNEEQTSNLNVNVQLFWKSRNYLVLCFTSQRQCRNENQTFISYFVFQFQFQFRNGTLGTKIQITF